MDVCKTSEREALVGDTILHAEDRLLMYACSAQPLQGQKRVLGFHGKQDRIVGAKGDFGWIGDAGKRRTSCLFRGAQHQPVGLNNAPRAIPETSCPERAHAAATVPPIVLRHK